MKRKSCIVILVLSVCVGIGHSDEGKSLKGFLGLSENVGSFNIFDQPNQDLKGKPSEIFKDDSILSIVSIPDESLPKRTIVKPLCQGVINLIRCDLFLTEHREKPGTPIGLVIFKSGKVLLLRKQGEKLVLQLGNKSGALPYEKFRNILGIIAKINTEEDE